MKTLEKSEMLERNKVGRVLTEEGILNQGQQCSCFTTGITVHCRELAPACHRLYTLRSTLPNDMIHHDHSPLPKLMLMYPANNSPCSSSQSIGVHQWLH